MSVYQFRDTDYSGTEELDICGIDYENLIRTCAEYASTVSMRIISSENPCIQQLERFRLHETDPIEYVYGHYYARDDRRAVHEIRYYRLCPEAIEVLLSISDSIFKWISAWGYHNPEDLAFYREDGTVFFDSIVHEGVCNLYPRTGEEVQRIVQSEGWNKMA